MSSQPGFLQLLPNYIPESSRKRCEELVASCNCDFRIANERKTKNGDFKASLRGKRNRISVNANLNEYHFLITLVHEIAHLKVWEEYGPKVKAHGIEWKDAFRRELIPFVMDGVFPDPLLQALVHYLKNPKASSSTHLPLLQALNSFDNKTGLNINELEEGALFRYENKGVFRKIKLRRTRILCEEISSGKQYLFHPLLEIESLSPSE